MIGDCLPLVVKGVDGLLDTPEGVVAFSNLVLTVGHEVDESVISKFRKLVFGDDVGVCVHSAIVLGVVGVDVVDDVVERFKGFDFDLGLKRIASSSDDDGDDMKEEEGLKDVVCALGALKSFAFHAYPFFARHEDQVHEIIIKILMTPTKARGPDFQEFNDLSMIGQAKVLGLQTMVSSLLVFSASKVEFCKSVVKLLQKIVEDDDGFVETT